jgi:hypothetical protein
VDYKDTLPYQERQEALAAEMYSLPEERDRPTLEELRQDEREDRARDEHERRQARFRAHGGGE